MVRDLTADGGENAIVAQAMAKLLRLPLTSVVAKNSCSGDGMRAAHILLQLLYGCSETFLDLTIAAELGVYLKAGMDPARYVWPYLARHWNWIPPGKSASTSSSSETRTLQPSPGGCLHAAQLVAPVTLFCMGADTDLDREPSGREVHAAARKYADFILARDRSRLTYAATTFPLFPSRLVQPTKTPTLPEVAFNQKTRTWSVLAVPSEPASASKANPSLPLSPSLSPSTSSLPLAVAAGDMCLHELLVEDADVATLSVELGDHDDVYDDEDDFGFGFGFGFGLGEEEGKGGGCVGRVMNGVMDGVRGGVRGGAGHGDATEGVRGVDKVFLLTQALRKYHEHAYRHIKTATAYGVAAGILFGCRTALEDPSMTQLNPFLFFILTSKCGSAITQGEAQLVCRLYESVCNDAAPAATNPDPNIRQCVASIVRKISQHPALGPRVLSVLQQAGLFCEGRTGSGPMGGRPG
jgi:hypothetical protein